jgi:signal transduction histidine kinase
VDRPAKRATANATTTARAARSRPSAASGLAEARAQQSATSEILAAISRSRSDVQPVFETIAESALRLCGGIFSAVHRFDGQLIHIGALRNISSEGDAAFRRTFPAKPSRSGALHRAILTGQMVHMPDIALDPEYAYHEIANAAGFRSVLSIPMLHDGAPIGAVTVYRNVGGHFPQEKITLLRTFADQAVIAIENVRLFNELEARTAQLTRSVRELHALGEVGQAVSSTLDVETVLATVVARITKLTGMDGGSIYEYDDKRGEFHLHSADGLPADVVEALRASPIRKGEGALGKLATTREAVEIRDVADERVYQSRVRNALVRIGYRSMLVVPLLREDHLLGGLVVNRKAPGAFDPGVRELMKAFAAQSAIAIQNARHYREIETKSRQLETASRHKSEFLANMSHELRTPLNAIIGFSEVLGERLFGELNDKQAEYIGDIAESGRHLLALINDILDLSKVEAGRMELDLADVDAGKTIAHTLSLVRERAERCSIVIGSNVEAVTVRADERKVKQVLLNLLSNALKFTPQGGRIDVRVKALADRIEVSVADTGVGIAPEDQDKVFEEFRQVGASAARVEGTGLGLAISRKFIELHGGRMWLESAPGKGSTFTFSLPVDGPPRAA